MTVRRYNVYGHLLEDTDPDSVALFANFDDYGAMAAELAHAKQLNEALGYAEARNNARNRELEAALREIATIEPGAECQVGCDQIARKALGSEPETGEK